MSDKLPQIVILDRDGTVIVDKDYLANPGQVELLPGAVEGLKALAQAGLSLAITTNQSGVGRGFFTLADVESVNREIERQLAEHGIVLEDFFICPHAPDTECECRKPQPGLIYQAAKKLGFDPGRCVVIGDKISDLGMGRAVGATTILVRTGKGALAEAELSDQADFVADNLEQAARIILKHVARD